VQNTLLELDKQLAVIRRESTILERNISLMKVRAGNDAQRLSAACLLAVEKEWRVSGLCVVHDEPVA
jgi:hypothetical protein